MPLTNPFLQIQSCPNSLCFSHFRAPNWILWSRGLWMLTLFFSWGQLSATLGYLSVPWVTPWPSLLLYTFSTSYSWVLSSLGDTSLSSLLLASIDFGFLSPHIDGYYPSLDKDYTPVFAWDCGLALLREAVAEFRLLVCLSQSLGVELGIFNLKTFSDNFSGQPDLKSTVTCFT